MLSTRWALKWWYKIISSFQMRLHLLHSSDAVTYRVLYFFCTLLKSCKCQGTASECSHILEETQNTIAPVSPSGSKLLLRLSKLLVPMESLIIQTSRLRHGACVWLILIITSIKLFRKAEDVQDLHISQSSHGSVELEVSHFIMVFLKIPISLFVKMQTFNMEISPRDELNNSG